MPYTVEIDKQSCQSSGRCLQEEPEAFRLDGDHLAEPLPPSASLPLARLLEIARGCPALAITIHTPEAAGRPQVPVTK